MNIIKRGWLMAKAGGIFSPLSNTSQTFPGPEPSVWGPSVHKRVLGPSPPAGTVELSVVEDAICSPPHTGGPLSRVSALFVVVRALDHWQLR